MAKAQAVFLLLAFVGLCNKLALGQITNCRSLGNGFNGVYEEARGGYIYSLINSRGSWSDARQRCFDIGSNLITLDTVGERDYVYGLITKVNAGQSYWLGGTTSGRGRTGTGTWLNGRGVPPSWFYPGQPDGDGSCLSYHYIYRALNDANCERARQGAICRAVQCNTGTGVGGTGNGFGTGTGSGGSVVGTGGGMQSGTGNGGSLGSGIGSGTGGSLGTGGGTGGGLVSGGSGGGLIGGTSGGLVSGTGGALSSGGGGGTSAGTGLVSGAGGGLVSGAGGALGGSTGGLGGGGFGVGR